MSNKIVPTVYRSVIDDVVANVRADFDEFGIEEDLLALLQQKWEQKLLASGVAQFEKPEPTASSSRAQHLPQPAPPPIPPLPKAELVHQQMLPPAHNPAGLSLGLGLPQLSLPVPRPGGAVGAQQAYGQQVYGQQQAQAQQQTGAGGQQQQQQQWNGGLRGGAEDLKGKGPARLRGGAGEEYAIISESDSSDDDSASNSSHTSSPKKPTIPAAAAKPAVPAVKPQANEFGIFPGDEEINSDLDDSEDELDDNEGNDVGPDDGDMVFCVYDKVNRVKNKWKMVFRDGMARVNGKDYLFAKATCDVEW